jgi:hypothetical protein
MLLSEGILKCSNWRVRMDAFWMKKDVPNEGHLEVLKYTRENGCSWDEWTCSTAVEYGHLEVFNRAQENKCHI